jgi:hypothetical protein
LSTKIIIFHTQNYVLVKYWRSLGFPIVIYLDDGLGTAENYELGEKMSVQVRGDLIKSI